MNASLGDFCGTQPLLVADTHASLMCFKKSRNALGRAHIAPITVQICRLYTVLLTATYRKCHIENSNNDEGDTTSEHVEIRKMLPK